MIVFLVSGLWHGSAWTFVLWGALHGIYQIIGYYTDKPRRLMWDKLGVSQENPWLCLLKRFNTFVLVCFAWIFFRANSFSDLGILLSKLFTDWQFSRTYLADTYHTMGLSVAGIVITVFSVIVMSQLDRGVYSEVFSRSKTRNSILDEGSAIVPRISVIYIVWIIAIAWVLLLAGDSTSSFIYFQF